MVGRMNVWGVGGLENEVGAAFAQEVVQDGAFALVEAFEVAVDPDTDFLAAEEGHRALAAAEIVGAALSGETAGLTDAGLRAWVQGADRATLEPLVPQAREALERTLGPDSELPELWEDGEDAERWRGHVQSVRAQLG